MAREQSISVPNLIALLALLGGLITFGMHTAERLATLEARIADCEGAK